MTHDLENIDHEATRLSGIPSERGPQWSPVLSYSWGYQHVGTRQVCVWGGGGGVGG